MKLYANPKLFFYDLLSDNLPAYAADMPAVTQ